MPTRIFTNPSTRIQWLADDMTLSSIKYCQAVVAKLTKQKSPLSTTIICRLAIALLTRELSEFADMTDNEKDQFVASLTVVLRRLQHGINGQLKVTEAELMAMSDIPPFKDVFQVATALPMPESNRSLKQKEVTL
jgi:hypothetical protein